MQCGIKSRDSVCEAIHNDFQCLSISPIWKFSSSVQTGTEPGKLQKISTSQLQFASSERPKAHAVGWGNGGAKASICCWTYVIKYTRPVVECSIPTRGWVSNGIKFYSVLVMDLDWERPARFRDMKGLSTMQAGETGETWKKWPHFGWGHISDSWQILHFRMIFGRWCVRCSGSDRAKIHHGIHTLEQTTWLSILYHLYWYLSLYIVYPETSAWDRLHAQSQCSLLSCCGCSRLRLGKKLKAKQRLHTSYNIVQRNAFFEFDWFDCFGNREIMKHLDEPRPLQHLQWGAGFMASICAVSFNFQKTVTIKNKNKKRSFIGHIQHTWPFWRSEVFLCSKGHQIVFAARTLESDPQTTSANSTQTKHDQQPIHGTEILTKR